MCILIERVAGMSKVLVLGGAGYIGSHTVNELLRRGRQVVVADSLETGHRGAISESAAFYHGDIRDRSFVDSIFEREDIGAVIHFAAYSLVGESMTNPLKYYDNNLGGTRVLLESMVAHDIKRIVFSSTAATYGEPERTPILETDATVPTNAYGATKLAMEQMFKWTDIVHAVRFVSLRYFNACGAQQDGRIGEDHNPETHLIPLVLKAAAGQSDCITIYGDDYDTKDGTCVRDYIHVVDLAQAHVLALEYLEKGGESDIFNLGNGVGFTVKEVISAAEKIVGHSINTQIGPRRDGDPAVLVASSEKAKSLLGWKPELDDIETIISSAWKWHSTHPKGFDDRQDN